MVHWGKAASLCEDLATLDWSTALDQGEMYRTARQKHDAGWNRAVWHSRTMKYALAKAVIGEEVAEEEYIEEDAGLDADEAGNAVSHPFEEPISSAGAGAVIEKPAGPNVEEAGNIMNAYSAMSVPCLKLRQPFCKPRAREEASAKSEIEEPAGPDDEAPGKAIHSHLRSRCPRPRQR